MINRISAALAALVFSIAAYGSGSPVSTDVSLTVETGVASAIPDKLRIKSDLEGHFMYVPNHEGGFWSFFDISAVESGAITSSRRVGANLEFNYTFFLSNDQLDDSKIFRTKALVTYQQVDGAWKLHSIEERSINQTGMRERVLPQSLGEDC